MSGKLTVLEDNAPRRLDVVLRVTNACNLACEYCYVHKENTRSKETLTSQAAIRILHTLADYVGKGGRVSITLHGGEPLMAGMEFYRRIAAESRMIREAGTSVRLGMQTNATLLTAKKAEELASLGITDIGISLDGDEKINGLVRVGRHGTNPYAQIADAVRVLRARKETCAVVTVVSKANIRSLIRVYEHHKQLGFTVMQFNPRFSSSNNPGNDGLSITPEEWNEQMIELFRHCWADRERGEVSRVDPFAAFMEACLIGQGPYCDQMPTCQSRMVCVDSNGDVLPCNRFDRGDGFLYGNIFATPFDEIMRSEPRRMLLRRSERLDESCSACRHRSRCHGGCLHNAFAATGDPFRKGPFCSRPLYDVIEEHLRTKIQTTLAAMRSPDKTTKHARES